MSPKIDGGNIDAVVSLMESDSMAQLFVLEAIARYSNTVASAPPEMLESMRGDAISPEAWRGAACRVRDGINAYLGTNSPRDNDSQGTPRPASYVLIEEGTLMDVSLFDAVEIRPLGEDPDSGELVPADQTEENPSAFGVFLHYAKPGNRGDYELVDGIAYDPLEAGDKEVALAHAGDLAEQLADMVLAASPHLERGYVLGQKTDSLAIRRFGCEKG